MSVLFIARYRDPTMDRKVRLLAAMDGLTVRQVRPAVWRDDLLAATQSTSEGSMDQVAVPMWGRPDDPHRALYRTVALACANFSPISFTPKRSRTAWPRCTLRGPGACSRRAPNSS